MNIWEDTRNKIGKHKELNKKLKELGHVVERHTLSIGDYELKGYSPVSIDTKQDWVELAGNICGPQHSRFRRECLRAMFTGKKLIILVEEEVDIDHWTSPKKRNGKPISNVEASTLSKAMKTMTMRYGVEFKHCSKDKTAETIVSLLGG